MRILLVNDDGIGAPGLLALEEIARSLSDDVWTVAPLHDQSGMGGALTYRDPLRLFHKGEKLYAVNGTPTDCVILALEHLLQDKLPDLVLSGINSGENVAESLAHSGTVNAAMEGAVYGIKSIALSQVTKESSQLDWSVPKAKAAKVITDLLDMGWNANVVMNINFPKCSPDEVKGVYAASQGRRTQLSGTVECIDPRGYPYYWVGVLHEEKFPKEGTDLWALSQNYIAVTPIQLDVTDTKTMGDIELMVEGKIQGFKKVSG